MGSFRDKPSQNEDPISQAQRYVPKSWIRGAMALLGVSFEALQKIMCVIEFEDVLNCEIKIELIESKIEN